MLDAVLDGDIAPDFEATSLIPVVFCHGISSHRTMYSGICRDLASHGYIVFSLDHRDGTASFYKDAKGDKAYYDNSRLLFDKEHRRS